MKFNLTNLGSAAAVRAVLVTLFIALAAVSAQGLWKLLGPREMARLPASDAPAVAVDLAAVAGLLGTPAQPKSPEQVNPLADVILSGVYRAGEGGGFAVLRIGNQAPRAIHAGAEIRPGIKLAKLGLDHAIFLRGGEELRLSLPAKTRVATPVPRG